jgi:glycosyltransferase involved in cell wall biosynthesis
MNVGGPAYHVSLLSGRLSPERYRTLLVAGALGPGEASFAGLAERYGARVREVPEMGPELRPSRDLRTVRILVRLMRSFRPDIVHTHTAKAGAVGRIAARIALGRRVVVVHTYHGHVLTGYFGPMKSGVYRWIERLLGLVSDQLVGVSQATVDELVRLRVAARRKFRVVPLGLDLDRFLAIDSGSDVSFRDEVGASSGDCVVLMVGRLVAIKRVDVALRAVALANAQGADVILAVVGDGEERATLERLASDLGLREARVRFLGFRHDLDRLVAGADVALLTSDNEGTPVALIEAGAGALPSVATDVGGVSDIVTPATGRLVPARDVEGLATALVELARDPDLRRSLGAAARAHVGPTYSSERLTADIDALYSALLERGR